MCDGDELAIYDTPLHCPIELDDFRTPKGLVIYNPDMDGEDEYIRSNVDFNTYVFR